MSLATPPSDFPAALSGPPAAAAAISPPLPPDFSVSTAVSQSPIRRDVVDWTGYIIAFTAFIEDRPQALQRRLARIPHLPLQIARPWRAPLRRSHHRRAPH